MQQNAEKILVVDDDPDIGTMLKMMLEFKGHSAVVAVSAEQAEKLLEENDIHLIIWICFCREPMEPIFAAA